MILKGNFARSNSVTNRLKCPKSKSLSHCLTELFTIYQHWTMRLRDNRSIDPSSHRIILKIVGFIYHPDNSPRRN